MKLEQQVINLGLSIKLKELGVKQESLFYWEMSVGENPEYWKLNYGNKDWEPSQMDNENIYSAFTVAELGEMLPTQEQFKPAYYTKKIEDYLWGVYSYECDEGGCEEVPDGIYEKTEADARAKMLIYLIENKLI